MAEIQQLIKRMFGPRAFYRLLADVLTNIKDTRGPA